MADDRDQAQEAIDEATQYANILRSMPDDVLRLFNVITSRRTLLEAQMGQLAREIANLRVTEDEILQNHGRAMGIVKDGIRWVT